MVSPFALGAPGLPGDTVDVTITVTSGLARSAQFEVSSTPVIANLDLGEPFATLYELGPQTFLYRFFGFADVLISHDALVDHTTVECQVLTSADADLVPVMVSGTVMAAICQLRGHLVLHASGVEHNGHAVALVGESGAGKSTLAAMACIGGARLVTDDVLRVDVEGSVRCFRGARALRLRPGTRALVGASADSQAKAADGRVLMTPAPTSMDIMALTAIVMPQLQEAGATLSKRLLDPKAAVLGLLAVPRIHGWKHHTSGRLFDQLVDLASRVPVFSLDVPRGLSPGDAIFSELHAVLF